MAAPVSTMAGWQWPAEVLEYASQHGLRTCLDPLLEGTKRVFPTACGIRVTLEEDPEIPGDKHIVFHVETPRPSVSDFVGTVHQWNDQLHACCPAPLSCTFGLSLHLVS